MQGSTPGFTLETHLEPLLNPTLEVTVIHVWERGPILGFQHGQQQSGSFRLDVVSPRIGCSIHGTEQVRIWDTLDFGLVQHALDAESEKGRRVRKALACMPRTRVCIDVSPMKHG